MLHHATLEIHQAGADAEVAFWALLGYAEVAPSTARLADSARWVQDVGEDSRHQIHLMYEAEPTIPRRAHLAIVRPAYETVLDGLHGAGFEVLDRECYWGSPRAFVHSPAGHRVEVMAFGPPV